MKVDPGSLFRVEELAALADGDNPDYEVLREVCRLTDERAKQGASFNTVAFSYFFEILTRKPFQATVNAEVAAKAAEVFQARNDPGAWVADRETLLAFATRVEENVHDWESFEINYLESANVDRDRLRKNLAMTPAERAARHARLLKQLQILYEARERYRPSSN